MQSTENPLILDGDGYKLRIAPEAEAIKADLLKHAALVVEVNDSDAAAAAQSQIKKLAAVRIAVDKCRTTVKAPVLTIGRDIDAKASEFMADLLQAEARLKKLVEDYAAELERERVRIARELEAKRRAEEQAAREAEAARLKAEREAEEARQKAAAAEWEDDEEEKARAEEAARKAAEEAAAKQAAAEEAKQEASRPILEVAPVRPAGVKFTLDFEVVDIERLYHTRPEFVKMEAKRAEILAHLKTLHDTEHLEDGLLKIGLKLIRKPVVSTR